MKSAEEVADEIIEAAWGDNYNRTHLISALEQARREGAEEFRERAIAAEARVAELEALCQRWVDIITAAHKKEIREPAKLWGPLLEKAYHQTRTALEKDDD